MSKEELKPMDMDFATVLEYGKMILIFLAAMILCYLVNRFIIRRKK